jgi:GNAT superfamily N-acetyltransferase
MTSPLPASYSARHPVPDDGEAMVEMVNASSMVYSGVPMVNVEQLRGMWSLPGHTPEDDWLAITPAGAVAAAAATFALEPYTEIQALGVVHPEHEGRGLGAWALGRIEERAGHYLALAPADAAVMLHAQTFGANPRADALFRAHGFDLARVFKLMTIDFDAEHPPLFPTPPAGITFRAFVRGQDERAAWRAAEESFEDHWNHTELPLDTWTQLLIDGAESFDAELWWLALEGDEVVGVALCDASAPGQPDYGWVATLGVRRAWRGRGIAKALLAQVFADSWRRGKRGVGLGVDSQSSTGANLLYERAGMHVVTDSVVYAKQLRAGAD